MSPLYRYRIKEIKDMESGLPVSLHLDQAFFQKEFVNTEIDVSCSNAEVSGRLFYFSFEQIEWKGTIKSTLFLSCQRCLKPVQVVEETNFYVIFSPDKGGIKEEEIDEAFDPEEADVVYHNGEYVELLPILREQLLLTIPMTVLCKEDCLGLCPVCGEDRNEISCSCRPNVSFSPFATLQHLSEK